MMCLAEFWSWSGGGVGLLYMGALVVAILASGWYSGSEMGTYRINRLRLAVSANHGDSAARRMTRLLEDQSGVISVVLVGTNVANYMAVQCSIHGWSRLGGVSFEQAELYTTPLLTGLVFIFGEIVPKLWFSVESNRLMKLSSLFLLVSYHVVRMTGLLWLLRGVSNLASRLAGVSPSEPLGPRQRILTWLREGQASGAVSSVQQELAERVMTLEETRVGRLMKPISQAVVADEAISRSEFLDLSARHGCSRIPLYRGQRTQIIGVVNVNTVLYDQHEQSPCELMSRPLRMDARRSVLFALLKLQNAGDWLALIEHRRRVIGIITLEDVLNRLVGWLGSTEGTTPTQR